jgi:hypothetical protein
VREILADLLGFARAPARVDFTAIFRVSVEQGDVRALLWNEVGHVG